MRISFEFHEVRPLFPAKRCEELPSRLVVGKEQPYGVFPGMTKWRIAYVMCKTRGGDYGAYIGRPKAEILKVFIPVYELCPDKGAKRPSHTRGFEAVGKACPHIIALGEREYLRFVLQAPKRRRENDPIEIPLKLAATGHAGRGVNGFPKPFRRQQGSPVTKEDISFFQGALFHANLPLFMRIGLRIPVRQQRVSGCLFATHVPIVTEDGVPLHDGVLSRFGKNMMCRAEHL